jgi:hypothetical protein
VAKIVVLPADARLAGVGQNAVHLSRADEFDRIWLERHRYEP